MVDYFKTSYNADSPDLQGSVLGGILGGIVGMFVCILVILLCCLFQISFGILFQLFTGLVIAFTLLSVGISPASLTAEDWIALWNMSWGLLLLCAGLGLTGFFFTRRSLLTYVDWKRAPWYLAYAGGQRGFI